MHILIWRILQIKEGVIHRDQRLRWITLWDLQNSSYPRKAEFNNGFIIHSNISLFLKEFRHNNSFSSPGFLSQRFNNLQWAELLTSLVQWSAMGCPFDVILMSLIQYDKYSFQIWSTAAGYGELIMGVLLTNQKQGKFEWIIIITINERGWVGYEEFSRSRRVDYTLWDLQNSSYPSCKSRIQ